VTRLLLVCLCALIAIPSLARAGDSYTDAIESIEKERASFAARSRLTAADSASAESKLVAAVGRLARHWLGTTWGLGLPQSSTPKVGKINCGTFVGRILEDAGFVLNVKKLQRQPSQLIIESFVGRSRMKKFSNAAMTKFLADVRSMGPGLFIIGLDFHVGFLLQTDRDLRFVHASYITKTVVDEPAATAIPIVTSKYRVVGKILSPKNLEAWIKRRRIQIRGNW